MIPPVTEVRKLRLRNTLCAPGESSWDKPCRVFQATCFACQPLLEGACIRKQRPWFVVFATLGRVNTLRRGDLEFPVGCPLACNSLKCSGRLEWVRPPHPRSHVAPTLLVSIPGEHCRGLGLRECEMAFHLASRTPMKVKALSAIKKKG